MGDKCSKNLTTFLKETAKEVQDNADITTQKTLEASQSATSAKQSESLAKEYRDSALSAKEIAIQEALKAKNSEEATQRAKEITIEFANYAKDYSNSAEFSALWASEEANNAKNEAVKAKESETLAKGYLGQIDTKTTNYYKDMSHLYFTNTQELKKFVKDKEDSLNLFAKTTIDTIEVQKRDINQDKQEIYIAKKEAFDYALSSKDSSYLVQGYANSANESKNITIQKASEAKSSESSAKSSEIEAIKAKDEAVKRADEINAIKGDLDVKCAFLKMDGASSYDIKKELYTLRTGCIYEIRSEEVA